MPAEFSWPTVTLGMGLPSGGGAWPATRAARSGVGPVDLWGVTALSVALRGARRARSNHWPVLWSGVLAAPVFAQNHLLSVHLHHAERTFSCCICSTIIDGTGE